MLRDAATSLKREVAVFLFEKSIFIGYKKNNFEFR